MWRSRANQKSNCVEKPLHSAEEAEWWLDSGYCAPQNFQSQLLPQPDISSSDNGLTIDRRYETATGLESNFRSHLLVRPDFLLPNLFQANPVRATSDQLWKKKRGLAGTYPDDRYMWECFNHGVRRCFLQDLCQFSDPQADLIFGQRTLRLWISIRHEVGPVKNLRNNKKRGFLLWSHRPVWDLCWWKRIKHRAR